MTDYLLMSAELSLVSLLAIACFRSAPARWRLCVALAALPVAVLPWSMLPAIEIVGNEAIPVVLEALPVLSPAHTVDVAALSQATSTAVRFPWLAVLAAATVIGLVGFVVLLARHRETVKGWAVVAHDGHYLLAGLPEDWRANCRVRVVPESDIAVATGFLRPTVWLGERVLARAFPTVLVHELVHVRRHHTRLATAMTLVRCLLWWHPFAWAWSWIARREVEHDCDEACVRLLGKDRYRNTLAALTRSAMPQPAAVGLTGHTSFNVRRLQALERIHSVRARHRIVAAAWACAFAALVVDVAVVAEGSREGTSEPGSGAEPDDVVLSQDESGWWEILRSEDPGHLVRLAPGARIRSQPARATAKGEKTMLAIAGREQPSGDRGGADRPQLPGTLGGTSRRASPSLELSCSSNLETAEAAVNFHSAWVEVAAPDDAKERESAVLAIRSHTGSSAFYRKPLHDGTTATVEYRFDSEVGRIADVPLASRVDLSALGDWQSRFTLDAEAVVRISAKRRPDELTLTVSNRTNGHRTGKISFDLASKRAELDAFLDRCDSLRRAAAA